jgi:hypothetical protein
MKSESDTKLEDMRVALALATGALRALETQHPQIKIIRQGGERTLFGRCAEEAERPNPPPIRFDALKDGTP